MTLGPIAFLSPWLLAGLLALPVIWWLLRTIPPRPLRIAFPPTRILFGIENRQKTPAKTPWWLTLLRMTAAALLILALAEPVLNPNREAALTGSGPVVLVVDNGSGRISGIARFEGYTNADATQKKILRDVFEKGDAYFRTGDLLRRDRDGYFYFVDRIGDTFRWKGENVATSEVAEVLSQAAGVREANVYGVEVQGHDGRAGMAALVVDGDFDPAALHAHVARELPSYARPLFLRIRTEIEVTGTFKHRKVELAAQGFDPAVVPDPVLFSDSSAKSYVPLAPALYARIVGGEVRL